MKIFIDIANIETIKKFSEMGLIDGVTTNPTLVSREKMKFNNLVNEIVKIVSGPISVETVSLDVEGMVREARQLSKIASNIVVKIPMTPEGLKATKILKREGIKTNVTLVFSANQALLAAKAGATYVSPFIGRLDDWGQVGMDIVREILEIFKNYNFETEVIVASIRHPIHVIEAAKAGAHVATIPPPVLEKMFKHPLTDEGIQRFLEDWKKVQELGNAF
jgi:transaldolase